MTTVQQALHIFRKDARHLRLEIAGVFLLLLILIFSGVQTWEALQERGGPNGVNDSPLAVFLPVAWCLLIARVIQTEALPGDRHFWLTRPYSRAGLVLSKAIFIAVFINLPFLFAQALIVVVDGLPLLSNLGGLFWNQVLISAILLAPVAAIAALTRNLVQFLPAVIVTGGLLALPVSEFRSRGFAGDLEWIRFSVGLSLAVTIMALVLWRQYRLRRSGNTALLAIAATIVGMIATLAFPQNIAFAIQSRIVGDADGQFALRLADPETPAQPDAGVLVEQAIADAITPTPSRYRQLVELPIAVTGAAPQDLRVESAGTTFKTLSGITRRTLATMRVAEQELMHTASLDRGFYDAAKVAPVTVEATFYLTQYGNARTTEVPLDGTPVYIDGLGQCGVVAGYNRRRFVCRSAFRGPRPFRSDRIEPQGVNFWRDAYSPFPAWLTIYPVIAETYRMAGDAEEVLAPLTPEQPASLEVLDPVAYFHYTLETPNVRLADFAIPEPIRDSDQ